ncbi:hypothetical protein J19TS1_20610 [Heyndrickxia oleronia]|nr:hypothetical protein J19TS1_20610 [Heyndrickxia oleronia]
MIKNAAGFASADIGTPFNTIPTPTAIIPKITPKIDVLSICFTLINKSRFLVLYIDKKDDSFRELEQNFDKVYLIQTNYLF